MRHRVERMESEVLMMVCQPSTTAGIYQIFKAQRSGTGCLASMSRGGCIGTGNPATKTAMHAKAKGASVLKRIFVWFSECV